MVIPPPSFDKEASPTTVTPDMSTVEGGETSRRVLNAPVSEDAFNGWQAYVQRMGAPSFTTLMEVIGRRLARGENVNLEDVTLAEEARAVHWERSRRPKQATD